jgi:hypothetical protein
MSEQALRAFMDKLLSDEMFRERVNHDANAVVDEFDLSPAERAALSSNDEDALRRLVGAEVSGFGMSGGIPIAQYTPFGKQVTAGLICIRTTQITWTDNDNPPCLRSSC